MGWAVSAFEWVDRRPSAHAAAAAPARRRPARRRPVVVDLLAGLAGLGLGITLGLAVIAESAGSLQAAGGVATALGRLAGLAAAYAMVVVVVLVARVPPLERAIGQDRLVPGTAGWGRGRCTCCSPTGPDHRRLRAGRRTTGVLHQFGQLLWTYPGVLAATAGSCCCSPRASPPTGSRAGGWPTRRGGRSTSTPTSRCSSRSPTRSTRARRSSGIPWRDVVDGAVVGTLGARRRAPRRAAAVALAAPRPARRRRHPRGARRRLGRHARPPASTACRSPAGSSSSGASCAAGCGGRRIRTPSRPRPTATGCASP